MLSDAHLAAKRFNHRYIHTEYLLIGLLQERNSATRILAQLGCNPDELRTLCESKCERGERRRHEDKKMANIQRFTPRVQRIMVTAADEMREMGNTRLDSRHVLLALLVEDSGIGGEVLRAAGVSVEGVRAMMDLGVMNEDDPEASSSVVKVKPSQPRFAFWKIWSRA